MSNDIAASPSKGNASDLITTLLHRSPKLAMGLATVQLVWPAAKGAHTKFRERTAYTVKVTANDEMYDELHEWVLNLLPNDKQRALVAWTSNRSNGYLVPMESSIGAPPPPRLRLRYDGTRQQSITVGRHRIKVIVSDGEFSTRDGAGKPPEIMFSAPNLTAQKALLAEISHVAARSHQVDRKPVFRMLDKWGEWRRLDDLPDRELASVILPTGQLERLVADVQTFLEGEAEYNRRCIPWHRGHLYEGPPGTGKTSVARAIASHFGMDVWYLPLADLAKDCDLIGVINRISPRSMLLLEDVDVFHSATQRDDEAGVTLSGLLNALDGIATPHGLFTVLTTNTPDVLDKALIRPGRIDLIEHFDLADADQVRRLLSRWYGYYVNSTGLSGVALSQVIESCKRHPDPSDAMAAIARVAP